MKRIGKRSVKHIWKAWVGIGLTAVLLCGLCACGSQAEDSLTASFRPQAVEGKEADTDFISSAADFSVELFRQSVQANGDTAANLLISPESVLTALSMTANGAGGSTRSDMETVLSGGLTMEELNPYLYTYNQRLLQSEEIEFHLANSIWIKNSNDISVHEDFLQTDRDYYDAGVYLSDFDETTVTDINEWVSANTEGMINGLLEEIPDEAVLYLINALAFEGAWETPYEDYQIVEDDSFTNAAGVSETVPMLYSTESQYLSSDTAEGFIKYYEGGEFAFLAILPKEGLSVEEYAASMTGSSYLNLYNNRESRDVIVKIPEFTYDYSTELSKPLSAMGMGSAFSPDADFSRMADTDTGYLYINRVLHKTYIQVDRAGTKAAAVTAVEMTDEAAILEPEEPPVVYLDRPFLYAIIDTETGLPVFMGIVNYIA